MEPISRRAALTLGGLGLAGTVIGGSGVLWTLSAADSAQPGGQLAEPSELRSLNGRLQLRLDAARGPVLVGGRSANALSYNGGTPGPTLRLKPGDRPRLWTGDKRFPLVIGPSFE